MEAVKLYDEAPQNRAAIHAKNFLKELGNRRFNKLFEIHGSNDNQLIAVANHIKRYSVGKEKLIAPEMGLLLIARNEKNVYPFFQLILQYIKDLFEAHKKVHGSDAVYSYHIPRSKFYFADTFNLLLINRNPKEILTPITDELQLLFIGQLTNETRVKLSNYNEFDAIPYILKERYFRHKYVTHTLTYFALSPGNNISKKAKEKKESELIFESIASRYDQDFLDLLVDSCEVIIFDDTFRIDCH